MASKLIASFPLASSSTPGCYSKAFRHKTDKIQYPIVRHQHHSLKLHYRGVETTPIFEECARSSVAKAAIGESFAYEFQNRDAKSFWDSTKYSLDLLGRFIKPYVLISKAVCIISISLLTLEKFSDISPAFFTALFQAIPAVSFMSAYVATVNQLTDIQIDKINKPNRPLASGEYSFRTGFIITASCAILSFGLGWITGSPPLLSSLLVQFLTGTVYSINLPFARWKKFPALAALCMIILQGIVSQVGLFFHMQNNVFKRPITFPRSLIFSVAFMSFFALVLSLFKDIPDTEGDKKFGVQSLSIYLGQKRVFWICVSLLEMAYGIALIVGATSSGFWSKLITVLGHGLLALVLWFRAKSADLEDNSAIESFYMFLWQLSYAEYFIIPFIR